MKLASPALSAKSGDMLFGLHGLRGLAALWVLAFHVLATDSSIEADDWFTLFVRSGLLGVDLFFVMSGFIIADRYRESFRHFEAKSYFTFLKLRLIRIYPLHFLCLVGFLAAFQLAFWLGLAQRDLFELAPPDEILRHLFLVQAWGSLGLTINIAAWSISIEWLLYLLFPLLLRPLLSPSLWRAAIVLFLALGARFAADLWLFADPLSANAWMAISRGLSCFAMGLALERLATLPQTSTRVNSLLWLLSLPLLLAGLHTPYTASLSIVFALWTWLGARSDVPGLPRQAAYWMGEVSYALYIASGLIALVLAGLWHFLAPDLSNGLRQVINTAVVLLGAVALHLFIERPLRGSLRRRLVPVDRAPPPA